VLASLVAPGTREKDGQTIKEDLHQTGSDVDRQCSVSKTGNAKELFYPCRPTAQSMAIYA